MARKKRKGKFIKALFGLVTIAIICCFAYLFSQEKSMERDLAALKERGFPTSVDEYRQSLPREGTDGTKAYQSAIADWRELQQTYPLAVSFVDPRGPQVRSMSSALGQAILERLEVSAKKFRQAGASDWADFPPIEGRLPQEYEKADDRVLEMGVNNLIRSARFKSAAGEYERAYLDIFYANNIASNRCRSAVGFEELRHGLHLQEIVLYAWHELLQKNPDEPKYVEAAGRMLNNTDELPSLDHILRTGFVEGIWHNDNLRDYKIARDGGVPEATLDRIVFSLNYSRPMNKLRKKNYVQMWRSISDSLPSDKTDWKGYIAAYDASRVKANGFPTIEAHKVGADFDSAAYSWANATAIRRVAEASVAVLKTWQQTGKLPNSLTLSNYDDPFTGKPLRYNRSSNGFVVYSVGSDLADNGGHRSAPEFTGDIAMEFMQP